MKNIITLLALTLLFSCSGNQTSKTAEENNTTNKTAASNGNTGKKDVMQNKVDASKLSMHAAKQDSTYARYWCSTDILKKAENKIKDIDITTVALFLSTFNYSCQNVAEYSQSSNELLFKIAEKRPDFLLQILHKNSSLDKKMILSEFESPVNDGINIDRAISSVEQANAPRDIKDAVLAALKVAKSKQ